MENFPSIKTISISINKRKTSNDINEKTKIHMLQIESPQRDLTQLMLQI